MSDPRRTRLYLIGGVAVVSALLWLFAFEPAGMPHSPAGIAHKDAEKRIDFLDDLDLEDGTYAVMLHSLATGGEQRAVLDSAALKSAQGKAYYTDNDTGMLARLALSILFLSPSGYPPESGFVSVIRNKEVIRTHHCYVPFCRGQNDTKPPHERELAGLLEASLPVEFIDEEFDHHDKARAAHYRLLNDERVVFVYPPDLPPPNTIVFPRRVRLNLPAQLLNTDETGIEALTPFDGKEFRTRFAAAFSHAYPETEAYRLGKLQIQTLYAPAVGWPVISTETGKHVQNIGVDRIMVVEPSIVVDATETTARALLGPSPFSLMPEFAAEPEDVSQRLDMLAQSYFGHPCPGCFSIGLPVASVDDIKVTPVKPQSFTLFHYRIASP